VDNPRSPLAWLFWLAAAAALGLLVWLLAPVLSPFLFAAVLAYIAHPLVERLVRAGASPGLAATAVLLLLCALAVGVVLILLPLAVAQIDALIAAVPQHFENLRANVIPWLEARFGVKLDLAYLQNWAAAHADDLQQVVIGLLPTLRTGGAALFQFTVDAIVALVVLFYFLRDGRDMTRGAADLMPRRWHLPAVTIIGEVDRVLGEFLRGQLLVMLLMAAYYTAGLWFAGLDYALSVGVVAGFATFVPYLGVIVAAVLGLLTGLLQFDSATPLVWVAAVCGFAKVLEGYILVPYLVGDRIGLHPVAVIFALVAFGQLFGFVGVLLALPASAALLVAARHAQRRYLDSGLYSG